MQVTPPPFAVVLVNLGTPSRPEPAAVRRHIGGALRYPAELTAREVSEHLQDPHVAALDEVARSTPDTPRRCGRFLIWWHEVPPLVRVLTDLPGRVDHRV